MSYLQTLACFPSLCCLLLRTGSAEGALPYTPLPWLRPQLQPTRVRMALLSPYALRLEYSF